MQLRDVEDVLEYSAVPLAVGFSQHSDVAHPSALNVVFVSESASSVIFSCS